MNTISKTYLHFIPYTKIFTWSTYALLGKNLNYTQKYPFVRIGNFLLRNKTPVKIENGKLYKRPKIKMNGNGIFLRDEIAGEFIGTKDQFRIKKNQFLLSKIDARNGAFGVIPEDLDNGIITGNFWAFDVDHSQINPHYLTLLTGTKKFQQLCQSASVGTTNRNYLQQDLFLNFEIPLPKLVDQEILLSNFFQEVREAEVLEEKEKNLVVEIEKYLFKELGITQVNRQLTNKKLKLINFNQLYKWGVDYNSNISSEIFLKSSKFKNEKLQQLLLINPLTKLPKENLNISFIPMECVSDEYGEVMEYRKKSVFESKGYTKFQEGDLIWARITPCMENGKSAIVENLENGYGCGSTEFHVLRTTSHSVDLRYVHLLLRTGLVLKNATDHFTGSAGQQRVPKYFLENLSIPIPPPNEQKKLIDHVYALKEEIKQLRQLASNKRIEAEKEFEKAIFNQ